MAPVFSLLFLKAGSSGSCRLHMEAGRKLSSTGNRYITMETRCVPVVSQVSQSSWKRNKPHIYEVFLKLCM